MNSVYIVWQDEVTRMWHPVAKITHADGIYRLNYTRGACSSPRYKPFVRMDDISKNYYSKDLFPFFKNRVMPQSRPEFKNLVRWLGMGEMEFDPLVYLALSGGARSTDNYMVVPVPEKKNGEYSIKFLVSGIRYIEESAKNRIEKIKPLDKIYYEFEESNEKDSNAVALYLDNETRIGYCPRYLASDFKKLLKSEKYASADFHVEQVNTDAPYQYKMLCSFTIRWPDGFEPFVSEEYLAYQ